jgi:hypothetical protein
MVFSHSFMEDAIGNVPTTSLLFAEVIFGDAAANCRGSGICRIVPMESAVSMAQQSTACGCQKIPAHFYMATGKLWMRIARKDLSTRSLQQHFSSDYFRVITPVLWPAAFRSQLLWQPPMLKDGTYLITRTAHDLIVCLGAG